MPSLSKKNMKTLHSDKFNLDRVAAKPFIRRRSMQLKMRARHMQNEMNSIQDPKKRQMIMGRLNVLQGRLKSFDKTGNAYIHNPVSYLKMNPKHRHGFQKGLNKYADKQPKAVRKAYGAQSARTMLHNPKLRRSFIRLDTKAIRKANKQGIKRLDKRLTPVHQIKSIGHVLRNTGHAMMYHSLAHNTSQVGHAIGRGAKAAVGAGKSAGHKAMQVPHALASSPKVFKRIREQRLDHQMSSPKYYERAKRFKGSQYGNPNAVRMLKHQYIHHVKRNASHYNIPSKRMSLNGRKYTVPNFAKATLKSNKQLMNEKLDKDSHLSKKYQIHDHKPSKHIKARKVAGHHKSIGKDTNKSAMPKSFQTHLSKQGAENGTQPEPEENGPELD